MYNILVIFKSLFFSSCTFFLSVHFEGAAGRPEENKPKQREDHSAAEPSELYEETITWARMINKIVL